MIVPKATLWPLLCQAAQVLRLAGRAVQAEQALKASEIGYLAGKVDFLNLLDSERMILMIKNGYFKVFSEYGKSLAKLGRLVGKDLLIKSDSSGEENQ